MNIQPQIVALENLARIDEELAELESKLTQEQVALGEKRGHLQGLEQKLSSTSGSIGEMERLRGELLSEARQIGAQMERSREKLARCRTEREVNAAQREVEELRKLYRDREVEIQKLGPLIEQARAESESIVEQRTAVSSDLGESVGDAESKMGTLQTRVATLRGEREIAIKDVQPVLYRRYEMIRQRKGSGLCHTTHGTCSACHIQISPMLFQVLRRADEFDRCPSCARILYYRPPAPDEGSADAVPDDEGSGDGA